MKIIHTDREQKKEEVKKEPEIIDKTKEQETIPAKENKKSNAWIWAIVAVVIILIIISILYYINLTRKKDGDIK